MAIGWASPERYFRGGSARLRSWPIFECDHCFVWGSPRQSGVMTIDQVQGYLHEARDAKTVDWIYFEGGEPYLYYPVLMRGVQLATSMGFHVGIVTNAYWATSQKDAVTWLKPFSDMVDDLSISCDQYHDCDEEKSLPHYALAAAEHIHPCGLDQDRSAGAVVIQ